MIRVNSAPRLLSHEICIKSIKASHATKVWILYSSVGTKTISLVKNKTTRIEEHEVLRFTRKLYRKSVELIIRKRLHTQHLCKMCELPIHRKYSWKCSSGFERYLNLFHLYFQRKTNSRNLREKNNYVLLFEEDFLNILSVQNKW